MESPNAFTLLVSALVAILAAKIVSTVYKTYTYWRKRGVPEVPSVPFFGSGWRAIFRRITFPEHSMSLYNLHPDARYVGLMDFSSPAILLRDPELIKEVTVKSFEHFPDHRMFVDEDVDPLFGRNVFSLRGERWREMRNTLSPSFTASKMRFMFELVCKCSRGFVDSLAEEPELIESLETKDAFSRYTTDVIATVAFGISVNSMKDRDNEFFVKGNDAARFGTVWRTVKFVMLRTCPSLMRSLGLSIFSGDTARFFTDIVSETVKTRDAQGIVRPDMIHLLMQARDKSGARTRDMTIEDIVAQALIFFLAGFDTTSTLMCYLAHELAVNPDIQEKLAKEVDELTAGGELTYECLTKMEYMDMVISETLRMYPPVILIDRLCVKEFELPPAVPGGRSITVKPGEMIWLPAYPIQHDPKYFPEPDKFDPERFSAENNDKIDPYAYMPFGLGPRKCIANRFALMETKVVVAHILQKFVIKRIEKTKVPVVFSKKSFNLQADGGFYVGLEKRKV